MIRQPRHGALQASCSGCTRRWNADSAAAHCPTCHRTFRSPTGFDDHRIRHRCRSTDQIHARGYQPNQQGMWRQPRQPEETR